MDITNFLKEHSSLNFRDRQRLILVTNNDLEKEVNISKRASLYEQIILANYYRSLELFPESHPSFTIYTANWLVASQDYFQEEQVMKLLQEKYPLDGECHISSGSTFWNI